MRAKLLATSGPWQGTAYEIVDEAVLGRGEESTIHLADKAISSRHARIAFDLEQECYFLEDLESLNGTLLDGIPVRGRERLGRLHVVTLADRFDLVFRTLDVAAPAETAELPPAAEAAGAEAEQAAAGEAGGTVIDREIPVLPEVLRAAADAGPADAAPAAPPQPEAPAEAPPADGTRIEQLPVELPAALARMADGAAETASAAAAEPAGAEEDAAEAEAGAPAAEPVWQLELIGTGGAARRYPLREGPNRLGRSQASDVWIDSPHVSRRHAVLTVAEGRVWLRDEGSRNTSQIDGEPIEAEVEVPPGATLRFGNVEARLVPPPAGEEPG